MVSKSTKPNAKKPQGGIVKQEASIHISNLNPVDPKTGKATRVGRKLMADGTLVRYSKTVSYTHLDVYKRQVARKVAVVHVVVT